MSAPHATLVPTTIGDMLCGRLYLQSVRAVCTYRLYIPPVPTYRPRCPVRARNATYHIPLPTQDRPTTNARNHDQRIPGFPRKQDSPDSETSDNTSPAPQPRNQIISELHPSFPVRSPPSVDLVACSCSFAQMGHCSPSAYPSSRVLVCRLVEPNSSSLAVLHAR